MCPARSTLANTLCIGGLVTRCTPRGQQQLSMSVKEPRVGLVTRCTPRGQQQLSMSVKEPRVGLVTRCTPRGQQQLSMSVKEPRVGLVTRCTPQSQPQLSMSVKEPTRWPANVLISVCMNSSTPKTPGWQCGMAVEHPDLVLQEVKLSTLKAQGWRRRMTVPLGADA